MHATTATPLAGGRGSGPENPAAYFSLFSSSWSVTDMRVSSEGGYGTFVKLQ